MSLVVDRYTAKKIDCRNIKCIISLPYVFSLSRHVKSKKKFPFASFAAYVAAGGGL